MRLVYDDATITNENNAYKGSSFDSFVPLQEQTSWRAGFGETLVSGMLNSVSRTCVATITGRGAYTADNLSRGTVSGMIHFTNTVRAGQAFKQIVDAQAKTCAVGPVVFKQGEADAANSNTEGPYKATVLALHSDLMRAFTTAFATPIDVPLLMDQMALGQSTKTYQNISTAIIQMHRDSGGKVVCVGPSYWHDNFDGADDVHLSATGYRVTGEMFGKAYKRILDGGTWDPCHITNTPSRVGTTITIPVKVPVAPLVFDESMVSAAPNKGFTYSGASITNVAITDTGESGTGEITITIDTDAPGTLEYALTNQSVDIRVGATLGPRGNVRDSDPTVASYNSTPLYNWLCADEWVLA